MLQLGLESGDQALLDSLGKGTKIEEISVILRNLAAAKIRTYVYALFGTPAEDLSAALRTRDFIAERAGESVNALKAEMSIETAMVTANCW